MTKIELLEKKLDYAYYNLFCYSQNYAMTKPKEQYVKEWNATQEEIGLWKELIAEQKAKTPEAADD